MTNKQKQHLVIFSGAGISAESGINTFRGNDGLWENHRIDEVATPQAFANNPELVLRFYNERRKQVIAAQPNKAHLAIAEAENHFNVTVVTQNIDDLHERAGSTRVHHLHGEIRKSRPVNDSTRIFPIDGANLALGDCCPNGIQLRPHVVWFGETVPMYESCIPIIQSADVLIVVGTSLQVYPAAGLIDFAPESTKKYLVDPSFKDNLRGHFNVINKTAEAGIPRLLKNLSV